MGKTIQEVFAQDLPAGAFPHGIWAVAGRFGGEYGVFLGVFDDVQEFVPESQIREVIANLKAQGETDLAALVQGVRGDVAELRAGRQKLVRDLNGKRI
jgi:hypothetical protein